MVQSCVRTNRTRFLSNLQVGQLEVKKKCFAELNTKRLRETSSKKTRWTPPRKWFYGMPSSLGMKTACSVVPYLPFCFPIFRVTRLKKNAFAKENKSEASYFSQTYLLTFDGKRNMFFSGYTSSKTCLKFSCNKTESVSRRRKARPAPVAWQPARHFFQQVLQIQRMSVCMLQMSWFWDHQKRWFGALREGGYHVVPNLLPGKTTGPQPQHSVFSKRTRTQVA